MTNKPNHFINNSRDKTLITRGSYAIIAPVLKKKKL